MSAKVQETVTRMFIEKIEERRAAGEHVAAPWQKLWNPAMGADRNITTGKAYRGGNVFMLAIQGFSSPFWATEKQIKGLGGTIHTEVRDLRDRKTGEMVPTTVKVPYTPVVYWNFPTKEEEAAGKFPFCRFYKVWNTEQVDGLEELVAEKLQELGTGETVNPIAEAQAIVDGWHGKPETGFGSARACYNPSADRISMPDMQAFKSGEAFYSTYFHELAHATGHRTRLNRDGVANPVRFASHDYSEEELIAEMSAAMLAGAAGIDTDEIVENSAAYLDHWLKVLKAEPGMLMKAGGAAQKACDLIRGIKWEKAAK